MLWATMIKTRDRTGINRNAMMYDITGEIGMELAASKLDMFVEEKTTNRMYVQRMTISITV
jgi:hypothetical protein